MATRRRARRSRALLTDTHRGDLGPAELAQHGDWRLLELPVMGRRRQRQTVHERLWIAGRLSSAAYEAGELYGRRWAEAHGALGGVPPERVDGRGGGPEPAERVLRAVEWLGAAESRVGCLVARTLDQVCGECESAERAAARVFGGAGGAARRRIERAVAEGLETLAAEPGSQRFDLRTPARQSEGGAEAA